MGKLKQFPGKRKSSSSQIARQSSDTLCRFFRELSYSNRFFGEQSVYSSLQTVLSGTIES